MNTNKKNSLPTFITKGSVGDTLLFASFVLISIYSLALIPFRAKLLVEAPLLNIFLTGGNFSVVALAAQNSNNMAALICFVLLAAVSSIKFLPLYFLMGKRWGDDFMAMMFKSHKPLWLKWLENFIYKHPAISLGLCYIPLSPVNPAIVAVVSGLSKVRMRLFLLLAAIFAIALKIFYTALGVIYGEAVLATLQVIDKYMLWITLALFVWVFVVVFRKEYRAGKLAEEQAAADTQSQQAEQKPAERKSTNANKVKNTVTNSNSATNATEAATRAATDLK